MLDQFKNIQMARMDLDELMTLASFGRALKAEYEAQNVPVPEFVEVNVSTISREIQARMADHREARKRAIKSQLDGLKTQAEKRQELQAELAALES